MSTQPSQTTNVETVEKQALNRRLEAIAWGLFFVMIGGLGLVPNQQVPEGTWLIGTGVIMLGLNAARAFYGIRMSGFTNFLGIVAILAGVSAFLGVQFPFFPVLLILIGAHIILAPFERK